MWMGNSLEPGMEDHNNVINLSPIGNIKAELVSRASPSPSFGFLELCFSDRGTLRLICS